MNISLIILAGGKSSRMGRDKADLHYHQLSFLENQIIKGKTLGIRDIVVSGYRGKDCSVRVIMDDLPDRGPLGGLETCLRKVENDYALVLGVDQPMIPADDLRRLIAVAQKTKAKATILSHNGREESLIGIYHTSLADEMLAEIQERKGSVFAMLNRIGYEVYETKTPNACFVNINNPEEYGKLVNG